MNHTEGSFTQIIEGLQREAGMTEDEAKSVVNGLLQQEADSRKYPTTAIGGKQARKERRARERRTAKTARRTEQGA